jgi:hypothetical protein
MTKDQAIEAMNAGYRVTHRWFSPDEYIFIRNGILYDENDNYMHLPDFWDVRSTPDWQIDWSIF